MRLRIETNQAVVGFMDGAVVFVTHAEVQRQPRTHLEIVLDVESVVAVGDPVAGGDHFVAEVFHREPQCKTN